MVVFAAGHRSSFGWARALVLALPLGCGAAQSVRAPAAEPEVEAATVAFETASAGPASAVGTPVETAVGVVTLIAKPGLWPLDVESARRVLQALGPVTREQPSQDALALVGGPYGALDRFSVAYRLDDEKYWVFGSAGFLLEGSDQTALYRALEARLIQLLGKPDWRNEEGGAPLPTSGWDLGEAVTLSLAPSESGEHSVRIAIAEPVGERGSNRSR